MIKSFYSSVFMFLAAMVVCLFCICMWAGPAKADTFTCRQTTGVPESIGVGDSAKESWMNMIEHCVLQQKKEYESLKGDISEDRFALIIDSCVNRKCTQITVESK